MSNLLTYPLDASNSSPVSEFIIKRRLGSKPKQLEVVFKKGPQSYAASLKLAQSLEKLLQPVESNHLSHQNGQDPNIRRRLKYSLPDELGDLMDLIPKITEAMEACDCITHPERIDIDCTLIDKLSVKINPYAFTQKRIEQTRLINRSLT